jgi:cytochrome b
LSRVTVKRLIRRQHRDADVDEPKLPMRVWDAPTRLFHWAVVILVGVSWLSVSMDWMDLHFLSGYAMLAALLFRLAWGFVGSATARFSHFLDSPWAAFRHLSRLHRREPDTEVGHNAAGGWMVLLMLTLLAVQVATGLCANDDVMREGPLAKYVGKSWSDWLSRVHGINFTLIQIAVVLHVVAIAAYAVLKRHDLVRPMITGRKLLPATQAGPRMEHPLRAIVVFAIAIGVAGLVANWL